MNEEELKIWDAHQQRFAKLSRELVTILKEGREDRQALFASYGAEKPPKSDLEKIEKNITERVAKHTERVNNEIGRVMQEFDDYDALHNPISAKNITIQEKRPEPEKPTLTGGSRFFNSLGYEKLKAQEAPDRSKDKSIDRDER